MVLINSLYCSIVADPNNNAAAVVVRKCNRLLQKFIGIVRGIKLFVGAISNVFVGWGRVLPALLFLGSKPEHLEEHVLVNLPLLAHDRV